MLSNVDFANNTISSCFLYFVLIIDLCFSILGVIAQIFNPIAELAIPIGMPIKEAKAEFEMHSVIVETIVRKSLIQFRVIKTFFYFLLVNPFCFISAGK